MKWNYNMKEAPLDVPLKLLSSNDFPLLPIVGREYIGTITDNGSYLTRGECIVGDPDCFYRSSIIAWMYIDKQTLMNAMKRGNMSEEKQIQGYESKQLIYELSKMPPMVIAAAYAYAMNLTRYGEDVTKEWVTATQNTRALENAYREGYHDALVNARNE